MTTSATLYSALLALTSLCAAEDLGIRATVDFSKPVRVWDGFGVNYVETAQTRDYAADPQEYGGFSLLDDRERAEILDLIFGADGLKPGLLKMFLDPFHEPRNDNNDPDVIDASKFDHETTTKWMRYLAREGLKRTRARGGDLQIVTTLYGPPAWATKQGFIRGRDLNPEFKRDVAEYLIAWAKYLRTKEGLPVKWLSLHNEGEDWVRWPKDGSTADRPSHDYNMYWPPEQVADFLSFMPAMLARQGMSDVGVTPGECTNWLRFHEWGYAAAIANGPAAMKGLGLITSHGFVNMIKPGRWFADWRGTGNEMLREKNPKLHSWVTSQSWGAMDVDFINVIRGNIYVAGVNGIIPWAAVQRPAKWVGGDPNPGTAFNIAESGEFTVQPGYYFFKQVSRAGQPGMAVAQVTSNDTEIGLIAFAANRTKNRDAFVVLNTSAVEKTVDIAVRGSRATAWEAYRTGAAENHKALGEQRAEGGKIRCVAPARSVTTFFGEA
jgi:O-glycosyl hydrolase